MDAGSRIGMVVPVVHGAPPALAQILVAESGIYIPNRLPVAGIPFPQRRYAADKRGSLRLIVLRLFSHAHRSNGA